MLKISGDVGPLEDELWDNVLDSVLRSSLNTAQRLSQLFILLRVHYTPLKLYHMGILHLSVPYAPPRLGTLIIYCGEVPSYIVNGRQ